MNNNRVSATLSKETINQILGAVAAIREQLPFLVDLTVEERKSLPRMGDKSRAFVSKALELASQNSDFLPRSFDIDEFRKDVELYDAIYAVRQSLMILAENVDDTYQLAGSEAYSSALVVYHSAKSGKIGVEGLDDVIGELKKRFIRKSKSIEKPE